MTDTTLLASSLFDELKKLEYKFIQAESKVYDTRELEDKLKEELGLALTYLNNKDEVKAVLSALNEAAHKKVTSTFEKLLSAICKDVLEESAYPVKLKLDVLKNNTSLDIYLDNNGNEESIMDGNGGAMTNVICAGLRLGVMTRFSAMRKFIIFDEPDCWIKPDRVGAFMETLTEACKQLGAQAIFISHHEVSLFPSDTTVIDISHSGVKIVRSSSSFENDQVKGFRQIKLTNFRAHKELTIPLAPGVTVITGPNNFGKSAINGAFRAAGLGISSDSDINHESNVSEVELLLENNTKVCLTRQRKKTPKMTWSLSVNGSAPVDYLAEERNNVPEEIQKLLGIYLLDDMDVQLLRQKKPIFLLDEPDSKKAQILSVGRESSLVQKMLNQQNKNLQKKREDQVRCEKALENIRRVMDLPEPASTDLILEDVRDRLEIAKDLQKQISTIQSILTKSKGLKEKLIALESLIDLKLPELPEMSKADSLMDLDSAKVLVSKLVKIQELESFNVPKDIPQEMIEKAFSSSKTSSLLNSLIDLVDIDVFMSEARNTSTFLESLKLKLEKSAVSLQDSLKRHDIKSNLISENYLIDLIQNFNKLNGLNKKGKEDAIMCDNLNLTQKLISEFEKLKETLENNLNKEKLIQSQIEELSLDLELLKDEGGGICPLCNSEIKDHIHAH